MDSQTPLPRHGVCMLDNANANIQRSALYNANRDVYVFVINSGDDAPALLREIRRIRSQPTLDGITGTDGFRSDDESLPEGDLVAIDMSMTSPLSLLETGSIADIYTRSMLKYLAGYPLYVPQPYGDLPEEYIRKGVRVGDVGIITKDGAFDFLFNIRPSENALINPPNLPKGFTLETFEESKTILKEKFPHQTHLFKSPVSRKKRRYTCSEAGGAILELPKGAFLDEVGNPSPFERLASRYGMEWYKYTLGARGRDISNGSLYLVTSCTKCTQWGIAVFDLPCTSPGGLRFVQDKEHLRNSGLEKYCWKGSSTPSTKVAPNPGSNQGDSLNQCVFVQGYTVKLRQDIFTNLRHDLLHRSPHASMNGAESDHKPRSSSQDATTNQQRLAEEILPTSTASVDEINNLNSLPVYPPPIINTTLLSQKPNDEVTLTHDKDCCYLVNDNFDNLKYLDLACSSSKSAINDHRCIHFEQISDKSLGRVSFEKASGSRSGPEAETSHPVRTTGSPALKELNQKEKPVTPDKDLGMPDMGSRGTSQSSTITGIALPKVHTVDENNPPRELEESESPVIKQSAQAQSSIKAVQNDNHLPAPQIASAGLKGANESSPSIHSMLSQDMKSPVLQEIIQQQKPVAHDEDHTHISLPRTTDARSGRTGEKSPPSTSATNENSTSTTELPIASHAMAVYKDIKGCEFLDNNHNATMTPIGSGLQTPFTGARMFDNMNTNIHGGEFYNANRDFYKIGINSDHEIMETIQGAVPALLEEIRKIQFPDRITDDFPSNTGSPQEEDPVAIEMAESSPSSSNTNRNVCKTVIDSSYDVMETLHAALLPLLEEIKGIQCQPATDGKTGINDLLSEDTATIEIGQPSSSSSLEIRSVADRYTRSMLKCLAGYPFYVPQPYSDFSEELYLRRGVCVGDVGVITKDGAFDFLFNICPSQNSLISPRQLPKGFTLETTEDVKINHKQQFPAKSHVFESPVSRTNSLFQGPKYTCSELGGAILELPEGAFQDDVTSTFSFRRLASRYGEQWYKYTIGTRGKDVLNGSLYLVTSCTKCTQWGIAVFDLPCGPQDSLRFVQNKGLFRDSGSKYSWKGSSTFTTKVAPPNQGDSLNQCVFVQGYKIMLHQDLFINLRNELLHRPSQASLSSQSRKSGTNLKQHRVLARRDKDGSGPDPGRRRRNEPTTGDIWFHTNFHLPPVHPSDLINSALLKQKPGVRVALTHDDDWRDLVKDIFNNLKHLDLSKIANLYSTSAVDENGCIYFEKIPDKSLVIAIDVGTTFSGVSYSLLEPGKMPRIQPVTRFAGQTEEQDNSKVPSVVYYDQYGNFIAAGSAADPETNPLLSDMSGVRRAEWFRLRLHLPRLAADKRAELQKLWSPPQPAEDEAHDEIDDEVLLEIETDWAPKREPEMDFIPVTDDFKNPIQVFADFLRYLFKSAKKYIIEAESNLDPTFSWTSVERNIFFVLTHPNGWEKEQQSKMREAAVAAGLVKMSTPVERITFLTEGEANIRFCLEKNPNLLQERNGLLVVDCGGGTIDLSAYSSAEEGGFREITPPGCLLQGSIFVTSRARDYFKGRFKDSKFGDDDDVEAMARAFDKPDGVKCMFSNPNIPYYVKFGGLRDTDPDFGIHGGKFRLEGAQVASFFEPAVNDIIESIIDQCDRAKWNRSSVKTILLVGGFGSSGYLYTRLDDYFRPKGITIHRLDTTQLNKAVADGAVSYYLRRVHKDDQKEREEGH